MNNTSTVVSFDEEFSFFEWLYFWKYGIIFLFLWGKWKILYGFWPFIIINFGTMGIGVILGIVKKDNAEAYKSTDEITSTDGINH